MPDPTDVYPDEGSPTGYSDINGNMVDSTGQRVSYDSSGQLIDSNGNVIGNAPAADTNNVNNKTTTPGAGNTDAAGNPITTDTSGLGLLGKLLTNPDGTLNTKVIGALGGAGLTALASAFGLNKPNTTPTGYQGKIPKYTAERQMLTAPIAGRRPGSGGIDYGGGVAYRDPAGKVVSGGVRSLLDLQTAAAANPYNNLSAQSKADMYNNLASQGYSDADIRASADKPAGKQTAPDWTYLQKLAGGSTPADAKTAAMAVKGGFTLPANWNSLNAQQKIDWYNANNIDAAALAKAGVAQSDIDWMQQHQYTGTSPQAMAQTAGLTLPSDWGSYDSTKKIDYLNQNNVAPTSLAQAGVAQGDIDWMKQHGYVGAPSLNTQATKPTTQTSGSPDNSTSLLPGNEIAREMPEMPSLARGGLTSNGFVVPADVVSGVGNGSTNAGLRLLAQRFGAEPIHGQGDGMSDSIRTHIDGKQEARVADGEAFIRPEVVAKLGGGDPEKGAKKLYAVMDAVRKARTGTTEQGKQIDPNKFMPGGIVGYADGGTTTPSAAALGSGLTGTESSLSNWAGDYVTNMLGQGQALAEAPYQAYTGPLTAGASDLQNKVFTGLQSTNFPSNLGQSFTNTTAPTVGADGQPVGGGGIAASYMNPYLQNVLQPQLAELRRNAEINNLSNMGSLTKSGAFGGGRQAIMESEAGRNLLNAENTAIGTGYSNAYDKAMQQFNTEQGQAKSLADLMATQGQTQRGIESEGIAADKAQFEEARNNPFKMVQFQQSLLSGLPLSAQSYNVAQPSTLQQILSGAGGGANLLGGTNTNLTLQDVQTALGKLGINI